MSGSLYRQLDRIEPMGVDDETFEVIGSKGLIVRKTWNIKSEALNDRLACGATLKVTERNGERLRYAKLSGDGPGDGWISAKANGTDLIKPISLQATTEKPAEVAASKSPDAAAEVTAEETPQRHTTARISVWPYPQDGDEAEPAPCVVQLRPIIYPVPGLRTVPQLRPTIYPLECKAPAFCVPQLRPTIYPLESKVPAFCVPQLRPTIYPLESKAPVECASPVLTRIDTPPTIHRIDTPPTENVAAMAAPAVSAAEAKADAPTASWTVTLLKPDPAPRATTAAAATPATTVAPLGDPCTSRMPVIGDRVQRADGGKYTQPGFELGPGAVATVTFVDSDGDFKVRSPTGQESPKCAVRDSWVYSTKEAVAKAVAAESVVKAAAPVAVAKEMVKTKAKAQKKDDPRVVKSMSEAFDDWKKTADAKAARKRIIAEEYDSDDLAEPEEDDPEAEMREAKIKAEVEALFAALGPTLRQYRAPDVVVDPSAVASACEAFDVWLEGSKSMM